MALPERVERVAEWFETNVDPIQQYLARRVGADVAQDLVAETFRTAIERFDTFDERRGSERAWLFGIATNVVRQYLRTERRRFRAYAATARRTAGADDPLLRSDEGMDAQRQLAEIADVVSELDPDDLDVLVLTAWEDLSSSEVGAVLGIPAGTVRSRLHRVRGRLRDAASPSRDDPGRDQ